MDKKKTFFLRYFYSISGKLLTELSDESWYNLSISGEGQNNSNYLSFLEDKISYDYRNKIKQIIYSSIYYYRKGTIEHREISSNLIDGSKKFSLKPTTSGFTYVKRLILNDTFISFISFLYFLFV